MYPPRCFFIFYYLFIFGKGCENSETLGKFVRAAQRHERDRLQCTTPPTHAPRAWKFTFDCSPSLSWPITALRSGREQTKSLSKSEKGGVLRYTVQIIREAKMTKRKGKGTNKQDDSLLLLETPSVTPPRGFKEYAVPAIVFFIFAVGGSTAVWFCSQQQQTIDSLTETVNAMQLRITKFQQQLGMGNAQVFDFEIL